MLFSSIFFIFVFLPITAGVYYLMPENRMKMRNIWLLILSLIFYSWGEPVYVFLMIFSAAFNYFMAILIDREKDYSRKPKAALTFTVVINLLILGFFKYWGFLVGTINSITGLGIREVELALPIGISFYTFQALSYIFDVYHGKVKVQTDPIKVALYLAFFPQLIAGPIVNYADIQKQFDKRTVNAKKFGEGAERFILGLGKKVILANNFGAMFTEICALGDDRFSCLTAWVGIIGYTLQIYFDFSGYSDMAIGLARMFGFELKENFNYPYISKSITDFWRRWHISLGSWFRDYLYIPLGGNRCSRNRHIANIFIVWALTGLWHGASWNFVAWGVYYGLILILEKYVIGDKIAKMPAAIQHVYTLLIVIIGWTFFSITDTSEMFRYLGMMVGVGGDIANTTTLYFIKSNALLLIASIAACTPLPIEEFRKFEKEKPTIGLIALMCIFIVSVAYLVFGSYNPFLYFRF
ncbi:MAG: MBOAT family protein [Clostridiales bacterium]|nr:MBOAT family protein [Candidatus Crickella equi]